MSMLPSSITNISGDERQKFTTSQESVSEDEVIDQISRECCNGDRDKGKIVYQEAVNIYEKKQDEDNNKDNNKKREKDFWITY